MAESGVDKATSTASETASQLLAKILNQLSLSAWLPSGALVLLVGFVIQLGAAIDTRPNPGAAVSATFAAIGRLSIGSLLLVGLVIVVVTMVTQAFSFGAIRVLEGYWGTSRPMEFLAGLRADRHRTKCAKLHARYKSLRATAVDDVVVRITAEQKAIVDDGGSETFTAAMREVLVARVKATAEPVGLDVTDNERAAANGFDWTKAANRNLVRRDTNLATRLEDYPLDDRHVLPTRLGNVLRAHEDATGRDEVEDFVERVFDELPFSLQLSHDEQRTKLDLYCSMVFVLIVAAAVAVARFGFHHWNYQLVAVALAGFGCWVVYRAAISSARYYGAVLETVAHFVDSRTITQPPRRGLRVRQLLGLPT